jgi:hypothetical protein
MTPSTDDDREPAQMRIAQQFNRCVKRVHIEMRNTTRAREGSGFQGELCRAAWMKRSAGITLS